MALNPELINFFLKNIQKSNYETFGSTVRHLFEHLEKEVKDNPVYSTYIEEYANLEKLLDTIEDSNIPDEYERAKYFVFSIYKYSSKKEDKGYELAIRMFYEKNLNDCIYNFNNQYLEYLEKALIDIINANPEISDNNFDKVKGNTVFIIHGHDDALKMEVQLLLNRAGVNNIVLHEQVDKGRTIIDKLIQESESSNYAIALLCPDDQLADGVKRARQNVVLEIGYFMGKLGKERVRLLKKGDTEIPSDLQGILYENYDNAGAWKIKICKELMAAGIFVDLNNVANKL